MKDTQTDAYFDSFTPHFQPGRFSFALQYMREHGRPGSRVIDVGCGDGATLALIKRETDIRCLTGLDVSREYLRKAEESLGCEVVHGSILDGESPKALRYGPCRLDEHSPPCAKGNRIEQAHSGRSDR